jgi:tetratricopeptide (TPR) repeat protein
LLDWGLTYDSLNQLQPALEKLQQSALYNPRRTCIRRSAWSTANSKEWPEALAALDVAEKLDANFPDTYVYRGVVHTQDNQLGEALQDFRRALELDPANTRAQQYLKIVVNQMRANSPNK